jgi:hypothetical protein
LRVAMLNMGKWGYHPSIAKPHRTTEDDQAGPGQQMTPFPSQGIKFTIHFMKLPSRRLSYEGKNKTTYDGNFRS